MATTYGMGQYRMKFDGNTNNYITKIGDNFTEIGNNTTSITANLVDILLNTYTYRDLYFDLGNNSIEYGNVYFLKLTLPKHIQYTTNINVKICGQTTSNNIDIENQFQNIRKINVPNSLAETNFYQDVLLYELNGNTEVGIITDNSQDKPGRIYYNGNEYFLIRENNSEIQGDSPLTHYESLRMIESWKLETNENAITYNMVFSPKFDSGNGYKYIYLEIDRNNSWNTNIQYIENNQAYRGLCINPSEVSLELYTVNNILNQTNQINNYLIPQNSLNHIGVWGHPEMYLAINGEQIQIGKNGFYELDDFNITNLGVVVEDPDVDRFSIDYEFAI